MADAGVVHWRCTEVALHCECAAALLASRSLYLDDKHTVAQLEAHCAGAGPRTGPDRTGAPEVRSHRAGGAAPPSHLFSEVVWSRAAERGASLVLPAFPFRWAPTQHTWRRLRRGGEAVHPYPCGSPAVPRGGFAGLTRACGAVGFDQADRQCRHRVVKVKAAGRRPPANAMLPEGGGGNRTRAPHIPASELCPWWNTTEPRREIAILTPLNLALLGWTRFDDELKHPQTGVRFRRTLQTEVTSRSICTSSARAFGALRRHLEGGLQCGVHDLHALLAPRRAAAAD